MIDLFPSATVAEIKERKEYRKLHCEHRFKINFTTSIDEEFTKTSCYICKQEIVLTVKEMRKYLLCTDEYGF